MEEYHLDNIQPGNDSVIKVTTATMRFRVSEFRNKRDNEPKHRLISVEDLLRRMASPLIRAEKDGPAFSPATFHPAKRSRVNVTELSILILDYDANAAWPDDLDVWFDQRILFLAHTTHSHRRVTADHHRAADRFRVIVPLLEPIPSAEFLKLWKWAYQLTEGKIDQAARDPSRLFYKPSKVSHSALYDYSWHRGEALDWKSILANLRAEVPCAETRAALRGGFDIRSMSHLLQGYRETSRGWAYAKCPSHGGKGHSSLFINLEDGAYGCFAGCPVAEIRFAIGHPKRSRDAIVRAGGTLLRPTIPEAVHLELPSGQPNTLQLAIRAEERP